MPVSLAEFDTETLRVKVFQRHGVLTAFSGGGSSLGEKKQSFPYCKLGRFAVLFPV